MDGYVKPEYVLLAVMAIPGAIGGWLAANRGRNFLGWAVLCALFPIFLMVVWFKKPLKEVKGKFRKCECGEWVKWEESPCRYCGRPKREA